MQNKHYLLKSIAAVILAAAPLSATYAADDDGWTWVIAPYVWGSSVRTNLKVDSPPIENDNTTDFGDVVSKLSFAGELHAEAQTDDFGFLGDIMYISLKDSHSRPHFNSNSKVDASITDLAFVWSPGDTRYSGFEGIAGVRHFNTSFDFKLHPANPDFQTAHMRVSENWSDFLLGVRYTVPVSGSWSVSVRGDTGFGDTNGDYNVAAAMRYRTDHGAWVFGYRYMEAKFKSLGRDVKLELFGPEIGYAFVF